MNNRNQLSSNTEKLESSYSNYHRIGFNAFEFLLDFGMMFQGTEEETYHTRIIINPASAMSLLRTLQKSLQEYQNEYNNIQYKEGE